MGPRGENNPKGFFENRAFVRFNAELLQSAGGIWKDPPSLPPGWEADPRLDPVRERAREMLESTFGDAPLWGWKDPRSALTLPFWQALLPDMRYVVCVRNPLDVAASLEHRNQLPPAAGLRGVAALPGGARSCTRRAGRGCSCSSRTTSPSGARRSRAWRTSSAIRPRAQRPEVAGARERVAGGRPVASPQRAART